MEKRMSIAQKERVLAFVIRRRGYLVQAFSTPVPLGTILLTLNIADGFEYRKHPFQVIAETTAEDFWEQNRLAVELNDMGIPVLPTNPHDKPEYVKFYRLATD